MVGIAPLHCWLWDGGAKAERDGWWCIPAAAGLRGTIRVSHAALEVDSCWRRAILRSGGAFGAGEDEVSGRLADKSLVASQSVGSSLSE